MPARWVGPARAAPWPPRGAGDLKIRRIRRREERRLLRALPKRAACAEIGVWKGDHAAAILRRTRPRTLHLIDPWEHRPELRGALYGGGAKGGQAQMDAVFAAVLERFRRRIERGQVNVIRASSQQAPLEPASLDWVYIDGDHHYEAVKEDLEHFARVVRAGGYLAGDDYGGGAWFKDSVRRAVDEFAQTPRCRSLRIIGRKFLIELSE
jgi:SAM-dependent methyltransferase